MSPPRSPTPRAPRARTLASLLALLAAHAHPAGCRRHAPAAARADVPATANAVQQSEPSGDAPLDAPAPRARDAARSPRAAALHALTDRLVAEVARMRGLRAVRPVTRGVMDRPEIVARMRARVAQEYPPGEVALEAEVLERLGLIPAGMDYERAVYDLLEEQVAGFYDTDARTLYVAAWLPDAMQVPTLAHEITHALQDQHFEIGRYMHHRRGGGDAQTAAMAVIEGDALVLQFEHGLAPQGRSVRTEDVEIPAEVDPAEQPRLAGAPPALRATLLFPYREGLRVCTRAYRAGGFPALDALLRAPPASTEQVLHADKLASREAPVDVPARAPAPLARDYAVAYDDVMGELGARLFLLGASDDATIEQAAAGWGGDRAVLLAPRAAGGAGDAARAGVERAALVWTLVFDPSSGARADGDAEEFERVAAAALARRYGRSGGGARAVAGASRAYAQGAGDAGGSAAATVAAVGRRERAVVVLDRVPADRAAAVLADALASAQGLTPAGAGAADAGAADAGAADAGAAGAGARTRRR